MPAAGGPVGWLRTGSYLHPACPEDIKVGDTAFASATGKYSTEQTVDTQESVSRSLAALAEC